MTIDITEDVQTAPVPEVTISDDRSLDSILVDAYETRLKSQKTHYALGENSPGLTSLQAQFQTGREGMIRNHASALENFRDYETRSNMVRQIAEGAAAAGRPLDLEEEAALRMLSTERLANPKNIIEKLFARQYTNQVAVETPENDDPLFPRVEAEQGDKAYEMLDAFESAVQQQEIAHDIHRKVKARYDESSWSRWGWDMTKTILPGYTWLQMRDIALQTQGSSLLPGNNLAEQVEGLYLLPPDQFREAAEAAMADLLSFNVVLAQQFANALVSYSSGQAFWDNVLGVAEVVDVGTAAIPVAALAATRMAARLRATGRVNSSPRMSSSDARAAAGDVNGAARDRAYVFIQEGATRPGVTLTETPPTSMNDNMQKLLPAILDPQNGTRSAGTTANERARRLVAQLDDIERNLARLDTDVSVIPRVSEPQAIDAAFRLAEAEFRKIYHRIEDAIIDVVPERLSPSQYGAVDQIAVYIGKTDATPFDVKEQAQYWANRYWLKEGSYEIVERDGNVFIKMTKVVDETDPTVMSLRTATDAPPDESLTTLIGAIRSPDDILSPDHRMYRHVATYGGTEAIRYVREAIRPLEKLSRRENDRLKEILHANHFEMREYPQPDGSTKLLPGNRYDTLEEYEQAYLARYNEMPSENETTAYFTVQKLNDWDLYMRRVQRMQDKARRGGEQKSIRIVSISPDGKTSRRYTSYFEGRTVRTGLPWESKEGWTVAYHDGTRARFLLHDPGRPMFKKDREALQKLIDEGVHVIQPFPSAQKQLGEWAQAGGAPVDYVLAKDVRTKPLDLLSQVEARYGGHGIVPDGYYIKQPMVHRDRFGRELHTSDRTTFYFRDRLEADRHLKAMEEARRMLNENVPEAQLYQHLVANTPFRSVDQFKKFFRDAGGQYDRNRPFVMTRAGETTAKMDPRQRGYGENVLSLENSVHNPLRGSHVKYTQEREGAPWTIENTGTEANPDFKFERAAIIEPYEAILRSQGELLNSRFFRDYTIREAEKWVDRYRDLFAGSVEDAITDPIGMLRNPIWADERFKKFPRWQQAMNERRAILQLLSSKTPTGKAMSWMRDKILDEVYKRGGKNYARAVDPILWDEKTDPISMLRGASFTAFLGFWNPRHYFLNASVVATSAAITGNPVRAAQANTLAWMMRANRMADWHPGYGTAIGNMVRDLFGIGADEYKQMYEAARRAGVMKMEGEHARYDHLFDRPLVRSKADKVRENSHVFFKEGDVYARMTAWNTAYLEWRAGVGGFDPKRTRGTSGYVKSGPNAKLTPDVEHAIIRRTADLSANQTRASNNPLYQRGWLSIPTQFITYQARMQDLVWGGRLTRAEKARVIAMQSILWGGFAAPGLYFGAVAPVYEYVRRWHIEQGHDQVNHPVAKTLVNGGVSVALEAMLGREVNVGESFGPAGFDLARDLLTGDMWALGGASGKLVRDWVDNFDPFTAFLMDVISPPKNGEEPFNIMPEDFIGLFDEISVARNAYRVWLAHKYGQLITKSGTHVTDLNTKEALFGLLTGIYPQDATDAHIGRDILKNESARKREAVSDAMKYANRAMRAWNDGDMTVGEQNWVNVRALLSVAFHDDPRGFSDAMREVMRRATNDPLADNVRENLMKRAPIDQRNTHFKRWKRRLMPENGEE